MPTVRVDETERRIIVDGPRTVRSSQGTRIIVVTGIGAPGIPGPQGPAGSGTAIEAPQDKHLPCLTTVNDGDPMIASALSLTPAVGCAVWVEVNGLDIGVIGYGTKVGVSAYWSLDGGVTSVTRLALVAGATLHANGSVMGYQLSIDDTLSLYYEV